MSEFEHDVALSFAGAQRDYVRRVAEGLRPWGASLFFDEDFAVDIWGQDLNEYLQRVYDRARFTVMFLSAEYESTAFPTVERRAAFAAAMHRSASVLPVRFDDTELPGLGRNVAYLDARERSPEEIVRAIIRKLEDAGVALRRPSASAVAATPRSATTTAITIAVTDDEDRPLTSCEVALVAANGNVVRAQESDEGRYTCRVPSSRLMTLWVAHRSHRALRVVDVDTGSDLDVTLGSAAGTGSTVFFGSTGHIPPVRGRFNPIHDGPARFYVYIDNAAADGKPARPFDFRPGTPFEVEDVDGSTSIVTIVETTGNGSLVEYVTAAG